MSEVNEFFNQRTDILPYLGLTATFVIASLLFLVGRVVLRRASDLVPHKVSNIWLRTTLNQRLLFQASWIIPLIILHLGVTTLTGLPVSLSLILKKIVLSSLVVISLRSVAIWLNRINEVYCSLEISRNRPIKGFIQVSIMLLYAAAFILVISILLDRSPWVFLSGLGAMTAILLLIFRDTLLSLVAGLQLTSNDLIRVGDWVEIPQFGADGDVIDIALHAVRVQNWDRTITVIPTHKFLEHAFKNWRGMNESGGRRIKRSVYVDASTIRFLTEKEIQKLERFLLLRPYFIQKRKEHAEHNREHAHDPQLIVNTRRLTNIGTFRAYLTNYLKQNPKIHKGMTTMVRQLAPGAQGIPIEIYAFTNITQWVDYEEIQSDLFDHIYAIASEFDLRIFQDPSGNDLRTTLKTTQVLSQAQ